MIPCKDCLIFPICKERYWSKANESGFSLSDARKCIEVKCGIIVKYLRKGDREQLIHSRLQELHRTFCSIVKVDKTYIYSERFLKREVTIRNDEYDKYHGRL